MIRFFSQAFFARLFQLGLALIPAMTGALAIINDLEEVTDTMKTIIVPILSMQGVHEKFIHSWRAIRLPSLQLGAYYFLVTL